VDFKQWLLAEERQIIDAEVLRSYEQECQRELDLLIRRTRDPELRKTFEAMRTCPLQDSTGRCYTITGWIVNSLLRNGCFRWVCAEEALGRCMFLLLSKVGESGQPRRNVFDFDESLPYQPGTNPLEARIKTYIYHCIAGICGNRFPKLRNVQRPPGTITITQGPDFGEPSSGTITADEIPARPEHGEEEMREDIIALLRRQSTPGLPLVALFRSMLAGEGSRAQRTRFGHGIADRGRKIIYQVIGDYARQTGNMALLNQLNRCTVDRTKPNPDAPHSRYRPKTPRPQVQLPPAVRDYISILQVIQAAGGEASMAILGKQRRRWLERKPRDPASTAPTRLHDVLESMVRDGVLVKQGTKYTVGPQAGKYLSLGQSQIGGQ
jgi:hypothetical protein